MCLILICDVLCVITLIIAPHVIILVRTNHRLLRVGRHSLDAMHHEILAQLDPASAHYPSVSILLSTNFFHFCQLCFDFCRSHLMEPLSKQSRFLVERCFKAPACVCSLLLLSKYSFSYKPKNFVWNRNNLPCNYIHPYS
jgi:hypothetical protein